MTRIIRGRSGSSASSSPSTRADARARRLLGELAATSSRIGRAAVEPSATSSRPVSSSLRKRTSSISSPIWLDLGPRLLDQLVAVRAGQRRGLEQGEQPRERRAQLVRDRRREAGAELLVGGEVAGVAEVEERLVSGRDLVGDGQGVPQNRFRRRAPSSSPSSARARGGSRRPRGPRRRGRPRSPGSPRRASGLAPRRGSPRQVPEESPSKQLLHHLFTLLHRTQGIITWSCRRFSSSRTTTSSRAACRAI